jgi:hypothetical protein
MATLREYFDNDFNHVLNAAKPMGVQFEKSPPLELRARVHLDFAGNAKYVSCYIPQHPNPLNACVAVLENLNQVLELTNGIEVFAGFRGEPPTGLSELMFTRRVYFYSETDLSDDVIERLQREARQNGLSVCFRGPRYAENRSQVEKPLAFISHDSRDKDVVARPVAIGLSKLMCPVWYDEYSLKVGDRLRESIEKGLKECKKCVLVLSPNFLSNTGWTRAEFNSIFTRELIEKADFLLPIWFGVAKKDVFDYCPTLADRVAVNWDLGEEEVVRRLHRAIK